MADPAFEARYELRVTREAFETVRQKLISRLINTGIGESLERDKLVLTIQALAQVQAELIAEAQTTEIDEFAVLRELNGPA